MAAQPAPAPDTHAPGTAAAVSEDVRSHPRPRVRALRGATTVDQDTSDQVTERTQALLQAMQARNGVDHGDIISVLFTATDDIHSMFPATAARAIGFGDVPLLCAREAQYRRVTASLHPGHDARRDDPRAAAPRLPGRSPGTAR